MPFGCARKSPSTDCPGPVRQKKAALSVAEKHPIFSKVGCFVFGGEELRPCGRKFRIQHSKFKITWLVAVRLQFRLDLRFGSQPAECTQVRIRTAGLRPAETVARSVLTNRDNSNAAARSTSCGVDLACGELAAERTGLHERTCGTRGGSPPPGGGCGLLRLLRSHKFKIQNYKFGTQPAKDGTSGRELRAFAAPGCGPPIAARLILCKKPAAERMGLRRKGAALRPTEAAAR